MVYHVYGLHLSSALPIRQDIWGSTVCMSRGIFALGRRFNTYLGTKVVPVGFEELGMTDSSLRYACVSGIFALEEVQMPMPTGC